MPGAHSTLSPSAAKRWVACPPSARLNKKYLDKFGEQSSEFAEEGTKAHALSELKLRLENGGINQFNYEEQRKMLGDIPKDMDRFTDNYVDVVLSEYYLAKNKDPEAKLFIEQRLNMERWIPQCFGTSDAVVVSNNGLVVIDLKYGKGVPVVAENNYQGRIYALGALEKYSALYTSEFSDDSVFTFDNVKEVFCQPRLDTTTEEVLTCKELLDWGEWLRPYAELAWRGEGEFSVGEHCRFCSIKGLCRKRLEGLLEVASTGFESPDVLTDDMVAGLLPYLDDVEKYCEDVKKYAHHLAMSGEKVRGYKLVRGKRPARIWKNEDDTVDKLRKAGYVETQFNTTPKLKSPSELEKTIGKSAFNALLSTLVYQGDGALTLVPNSDKREEYSSINIDYADMIDGSENGE